MKLEISHVSHYQFSQDIQPSTQFLKLTPNCTERQRVLKWELSLPNQATEVNDGFGNILHILTLDEPVNALSIKIKGEVEIIDGQSEIATEEVSPRVYLKQTYLTRPDAVLKEFAVTHLKHPVTLHGLHHLMHQVRLIMPTPVEPSPEHHTATEAFHLGSGACQDHTHVMLSCCRARGLPARYVSGYVYDLNTHIVSDHAWAEVWFNDRWQTCDVTNGLTQPNCHLKLAIGLDYLDACPVRGVISPNGNEALSAIASMAHLIKPK